MGVQLMVICSVIIYYHVHLVNNNEERKIYVELGFAVVYKVELSKSKPLAAPDLHFFANRI